MENIPNFRAKETKSKLKQTPLNKWVKSLDLNRKKIFYRKLFNNRMLWKESMTKSEKATKWNNLRYEGLTNPHPFDAALIYVTARYVDSEIQFECIFPDIPNHCVTQLIGPMIQRSLATDNFLNI